MGTTSNVGPGNVPDEQKLANDFATFFKNKVNRIHQNLVKSLDPNNPFIPIVSENDPITSNLLQNFEPATCKEVEGIISSSTAKQCSLDPAPTSVIKKVAHLVSPIITHIINKSFDSGTVPHSMKTALIRPQLKETSLELDDLSNYRPVSNLSFLSKILEKAVNTRLDNHLENNSLLSDHQSAYRKHHSTETLLLKFRMTH